WLSPPLSTPAEHAASAGSPLPASALSQPGRSEPKSAWPARASPPTSSRPPRTWPPTESPLPATRSALPPIWPNCFPSTWTGPSRKSQPSSRRTLEGDDDSGHDRGARVHHAGWRYRRPVLVVRLLVRSQDGRGHWRNHGIEQGDPAHLHA